MNYRRFEGEHLDDHRPKRGPARVEPVEARFSCGCLASDVEWIRDEEQPNVYVHHPRIVDGVRVCPVHELPVATA